jgi:hypothetical protein
MVYGESSLSLSLSLSQNQQRSIMASIKDMITAWYRLRGLVQ